MGDIKSFAMLAAKVALAYAAVAAFQKHVMVIPVLGPYLPQVKNPAAA